MAIKIIDCQCLNNHINEIYCDNDIPPCQQCGSFQKPLMNVSNRTIINYGGSAKQCTPYSTYVHRSGYCETPPYMRT